MTRGRRPDNPRDQAAKGYPGKRKSKTKDALERMEREAARDAKLFADASAKGDLQALPIFLEDKRLAAAQTIWREYAPRLDKLNMLSTLDRYTFAMFCIYAAEFVLANKDINDKGYSILVTTIAGSKSKAKGSQMPRLNPSVDRRDHAAKMMMDLSQKFGFTPLDRNNLIKMNAMLNDEATLFNRRTSQPTPHSDKPPAAEVADEDEGGMGIGSMHNFDTPPPGTRTN